MLDAGCGTGNYAKDLITYGVGKVTLLDGSPDMLNVAKEKLKDVINRNIIDEVVEANMPGLPFDDDSFDVILFSQVLHHLDDTANGKDFPIMEVMFREAKRVLHCNGVMMICGSLPVVVKEAVWFSQLNHALCERVCKILPSMEQYMAMLQKTGFKVVTKLNLLGSELSKNYYDPKGPLKQEWRNGDSLFGFATKQEILDIEQKVREMNDNGTMQDFIKQHDRTEEIGTVTIIACTAL